MRPYRFRIFTLAEANRVLPVVIDVTNETRERLESLQEGFRDGKARSAVVDQETRELLDGWYRLILELGAQPKGVFTVDFPSPDPNVLWCWSPSEERITHRHFTWESFKDRVSIETNDVAWPSLN